MTGDADFIALQEALAGHYSLEREIGRGGMGIVYLAREVRLARQVAIKMLPPALATLPSARARFLREAQTAAQLSHPHIVPIHHVDEAGGFVFFVMAYIEGETLGQRVRARGPLPPSHVARILREVAWALAYAHLRGIVHRDVKPDNIMLEQGTGRAVVTDFGIADTLAGGAAAGDPLAADGAHTVMGSASFVSPEQAAGEPLDGRSDLYSLGIVAHFALTGRVPFEAATPAETVALRLRERAAPVASVMPALPRSLAAAVDRCLAMAPEDRPVSGEALADMLAQASERGQEIPAPLRVWITQGERLRPFAALFALWIGIPLLTAIVFSGEWAFTVIPLTLTCLLTVLPRLSQTRRTLAAGYTLEELRIALRQHIGAKREELAYEFSDRSSWLGRALKVAGLGGFAATAVATAIGAMFDPGTAISEMTVYGVMSGLVLGGGFAIDLAHGAQRWLEEHYGGLRLRFWNGSMGERFTRLAGLGLGERPIPSQSMLNVTELALGRATEHLFAALPKALRRSLSTLPDAVRRLEKDAGDMRQRMEAMDEQIASLTADARAEERTSLAGQPDRLRELGARREAVLDDLRQTRAAAAERLGIAVAALETIRLDLLRLQGGRGSVESLTAALEAARRIGDEVEVMVQAEREVDEVLRAR